MMKSLHFGIEIEMTGISRAHAGQVIAKHFGHSNVGHEFGYDAYTVLDDQGRKWKAESDDSINTRGAFGHGNPGVGFQCEVVSPVLNYEDIETVQEIVRELKAAGAVSDPSCGIHVHVGAEDFKVQNLINVVNIMASKEDMIYKALEIPERRAGRWCQKVDAILLRKLAARKPRTIDQLKDIWYDTLACGETRSAHYNSSRYHGINLHAYWTKGTVEFRLFNATMHAGKIKAYIQFCLAVANQALTQTKASAKKTVTDNEKYAFRCWLLRLGLIGDEYKTCRTHLLKALSGDSAWRHGRPVELAAA